MFKTALITFLALITGCGKAPEQKVPVYGQFAQPLEGKSIEEVLSLKYNNQVSLRCSVRVTRGQRINVNSAPADELFWSIPGELSFMRVLNYRVNNRDMVAIIKLGGSLRILAQKNYVAENRREYFMEHTPMLKIYYRRAPRSILQNGDVHERLSFTEKVLFENVEERLYTMGSGGDIEDLRCMLQTNINPPYRNQWQIIR